MHGRYEMKLLAPGEPDPVMVADEDAPSPFFIAGDHAGRRIPGRLGRLGLHDGDLERHIAWDIGIAGTSNFLADRLDATFVAQIYSRLVIDCNRDPKVSSSILEISELTDRPRQPERHRRRAAGAPEGDLLALSRAHHRAPRPQEAEGHADGARRHAQLHAGLQGRGAAMGRRRALQPRRRASPTSCSSCFAARATSRSATTSPIASAMRPTTRFPCMASAATCPMSSSKSART